MELKPKSLAQERFGTFAATYATSRSHAKGGSLPRLVELLAPQPDWTALDKVAAAYSYLAARKHCRMPPPHRTVLHPSLLIGPAAFARLIPAIHSE